MITLYISQILGFSFSVLGTLLMANHKIKYMRYAWMVWLVGTIFWLFIGLDQQLYGLVALNMFYVLTNYIGYYKSIQFEKHINLLINKDKSNG